MTPKNPSRFMILTFLSCLILSLTFIPNGWSATYSTMMLDSTEKSSLSPADRDEIINKSISLQVPFIENRGQMANESVKFYAQTFGGTVFITEDGQIIYSLPKYKEGKYR